MPETSPLPPSQNSTALEAVIKRLRTLTFLSLALNGLILLLLVVGAMARHHRMQEQSRGGGPRENFEDRNFAGRDDRHFHRMHKRHQDDFDRDYRSEEGRGPGFNGDHNGGSFRDRPGMGMRDVPPAPGNPPDPAKMGEDVMAHLTRQLSLSDEEKAKIKPIVDQQVTEFQKQREAQRVAMQKQMEDAKAKIRPLLTPDQQKQLDAMPLPGAKGSTGPNSPPE